MANAKLKWHRLDSRNGTPSYYAEAALRIDETSKRRVLVRVAEAVKSGRDGVDDYPWDWWLTPAGGDRAYSLLPRESMRRLRTGGVADTLRTIKQSVARLMDVEP